MKIAGFQSDQSLRPKPASWRPGNWKINDMENGETIDFIVNQSSGNDFDNRDDQ